MPINTEADMRVAAAFTPEETAADNAFERSPANKAELLREMARARDPNVRGILQAHFNQTFGDGGGGSDPAPGPASASSPSSIWDDKYALNGPAKASPSGRAAPTGAQATGGSIWDDKYALVPPAQATSSGVRGKVGDILTNLKSGVEQLPGIATGLADLPITLATGYRPFSAAAQSAGELTGFEPGKWAKAAQDPKNFTPEYQKSQADIEDVWKGVDEAVKDPKATKMDVWNKFLADAPAIAAQYVKNPMYSLGQVAQSIPSTLAGGALSRPLMAIGRVAGVAENVAAGVSARAPIPGLLERVMGRGAATEVAGAVGEGAVQAGSQMQQSEDQPDQQKNAIASLGSGIGDAVIAGLAGRIAHKLGLETSGTAMAGGAAHAEPTFGMVRRVVGGAVNEALLQEAPQSYQEQMWQNYAEGKPLHEGAIRQAVEGGISGGLMGAAFNAPGPLRASPGGAVAPVVAPVVNPADAALNAQIGNLKQAVDNHLRGPSVDDVHAMVMDPNTSVDTLAASLQQSSDSSSAVLAAASGVRDTRRQGAQLAAAMDRQSDLAQQQTDAGTTFEKDNAAAQAATHLELAGQTGTKPNTLLDSSPMDEPHARQRLTVLRDEESKAGGDPSLLSITPHPATPNKYAITRAEATPTQTETPTQISDAQAQYQLESAALAGDISNRRAQDGPRQAMIARALKSIELRRGVASPAEARILQDAGRGQPYDRVDPTLAPKLTMDQKLTQKTGIALDKAPKSSERQSTEPTEAAQVAQENNERSDSRVAQLAKEKATAAAARADAPAVTPAEAPPAVDVIAALKTTPALRTAEQKAVVEKSRATQSADDSRILQAAATAPFTLSATDKSRLNTLGGNQTKATSDITVKTRSIEAETGKVVVMKERADVALKDIDEQISTAEALLTCV